MARLNAIAMKELGRGKKCLQHNIVDLLQTDKVFTMNGRETHTHTHKKVLSDIRHTSFLFERTLYLWLTKLCTNHAKYIKIYLFTITTIIYFFT